MNIWLIATGEAWPTDGGAPRLLRAGINATYLASRGHRVVWWNSSFNHSLRKQRTLLHGHVDVEQGYRMVGLDGGGYDRNVSIRRISYNRKMAKHFKAIANTHAAPDIIVVSLTPLELSRAVVQFARRAKIPVVVDVRDFWPDIWIEHVQGWLRPLAQLALQPFYNDLRWAVRHATSVIGITDAAVDWALERAGRQRDPMDRAFPLVYPPDNLSTDQIEAATLWWRQHGLGERGTLVGCYFGAFTRRADFETPILGIQHLPEKLRSRIRLVFCGRGEQEDIIRTLALQTGQVIVPGWIDAPKIRALMELSSFGILPYLPTLDYARSLPNKVFEYLSGGLPIVTSLRGEIEKFLNQYSCGLLYTSQQPDSFKEAVLRLTSPPSELTRLKQNAAAAAKCFNALEYSKQFETYLVQVAKARN
jgi:glycosyltransferase involved in cell wall biosynthesis